MNRQYLRAILSTKLSQRLTMTPALLQKIGLLALNRMELAELLRQEIDENPVLEEAEKGTVVDDGEEEGEKEDPFEQIDVDYFFEEYLPNTPNRNTSSAQEDKTSFETFLATRTTLQDHLNWQLNLTNIPADLRRCCYFLVGNLDVEGYLKLSLDEVCSEFGISLEKAREALRIIQSLDPVGVGARDLAECLILQLKSMGLESQIEGKLVRNHLPDLQSDDRDRIARKLGCELKSLEDSLKIIRSLSPKPGERFDSSKPKYVQPDVYVQKHSEGYQVLVSDDGLPELRLNSVYRSLLRQKTTPKDTKSYIRERFRAAVELLRSVNQRQATIGRVCEIIVSRQKEFLDHGLLHLKPMLIKEVAEELNLHSSTISRVVANKYAHTPQGVMELRRFFNLGVGSTEGGYFSTEHVKDTIRKIIDREKPSQPLSDEKISKVLNSTGINITRRTVAKYRVQMNIAGSRQRKKHSGDKHQSLSTAT